MFQNWTRLECYLLIEGQLAEKIIITEGQKVPSCASCAGYSSSILFTDTCILPFIDNSSSSTTTKSFADFELIIFQTVGFGTTTLQENVQLLVTCIFSFSSDVFKRLSFRVSKPPPVTGLQNGESPIGPISV